MPQPSAIPYAYWLVFGCYEPMLTMLGFIGTMLYPKQASEQAHNHRHQAPWPAALDSSRPLPLATFVTMMQLANATGLLGLVNFFILWAARRYLFGQPALQEKIVSALLTPLLIGDIVHLAITLWALGDERWSVEKWKGSATLLVTIVTGLSLLVPRIAWHLGIGRYVHSRDGGPEKKM
ncbi:hypothetical protein K474DRAFT_1635003 [Panus rudis PR-1116 ss-1]|nr:hypothetical protein K474DRAFT_1635003 [Panus rudis PR-1116 ss-1]